MRVMKKYESLIYSAVGLAALFLVLIAVNYLLSLQARKLDLTEGSLYTLSAGTEKVLRGLEGTVKVKLYVSQGEAVPVPLRSFPQRVQTMRSSLAPASAARPGIIRRDPRP